MVQSPLCKNNHILSLISIRVGHSVPRLNSFKTSFPVQNYSLWNHSEGHQNSNQRARTEGKNSPRSSMRVPREHLLSPVLDNLISQVWLPPIRTNKFVQLEQTKQLERGSSEPQGSSQIAPRGPSIEVQRSSPVSKPRPWRTGVIFHGSCLTFSCQPPPAPRSHVDTYSRS